MSSPPSRRDVPARARRAGGAERALMVTGLALVILSLGPRIEPASADVPLPPVRPTRAEPQSRPPVPQPEAQPPLPPQRPSGPEVPASKSPAAASLGPSLPGMPTLAPVLPQGTGAARPSGDAAAPEEPAKLDIAAEELVCAALFSSGKVVARASEPVSGPGGCGMAAPIELSAVLVSPGVRVAFEPPVAINCALGAVVADWVRDDLVPTFEKAGKPLRALSSTSGYACRGRNHVSGAKLSEHGRGDAMDVGGFKVADGSMIGVKQSGTPVLADVKQTACLRFRTVLGPGSDGYHESHMHVDLASRRHDYRICHWDLPDMTVTH
ncbi:extensin family protein [Lichenihabitans sp. PAMC28606]|uniref:extensin-like domain-containing protein n=1 Tax=Lichenihabitans sp. PAMC28606 TaxID=2880932 RepID=UPI001D0B362A|nr:extensin family protein [Lichenihabitans sp. PAMC28606]UDL94835.1 extensin family protein [Lichenihabitans sp. PAMC28606]